MSLAPARPSFVRRVVVPWLLAAYGVGLALVLLWPTPVDRGASEAVQAVVRLAHWLGFEWVSYSTVEVSANVVLFVPLGWLVAALLPRAFWWVGVLLGVGVSVTAEAAQLLFLPERFSSVVDVVANSAGALLGALLGLVVRPRGR